ncbi:hypothetical protein Tco_0314679, partial [Tanacetum coccineum]
VREEFRDGIGRFNKQNPHSWLERFNTWLERFNKQNPHSFDNAAAPKDAENRISQLEEILMFQDKFSQIYPRPSHVHTVAHNLEILHDTEDYDGSEQSGKK